MGSFSCRLLPPFGKSFALLAKSHLRLMGVRGRERVVERKDPDRDCSRMVIGW